MSTSRTSQLSLAIVLVFARLAGSAAASGQGAPRPIALSIAATPKAAATTAATSTITQRSYLARHSRCDAPSTSPLSYHYPIKPFNCQHPIGANFDDPRIASRRIGGPGQHSFHDGVDIVAPDGTAVYAVVAGEVNLTNRTAIYVMSPYAGKNPPRAFSYWHVSPVVRDRQMVAKHQLLGYIKKGAGHVHFAEKRNGRYVNPLRPGGLTPCADRTPPTIQWLKIFENGEYHSLNDLGRISSGRISLVVNAFDKPPIQSVRWPRSVLTPTFISWSLTNKQGETVLKRAVVNFDHFYTESLTAVYAPGTLQNGPRQVAAYNFWLVRNWDTTRLSSGSYVLTVTASDIQGNRGSLSEPITIAN